MPMQEFNWKPGFFTFAQAETFGAKLERALRASLHDIRPDKKEFGVFVEGAPFGPVTVNQKDLRVWIFYHAEWDFSEEERETLWVGMRSRILIILHDLEFSHPELELRFYARCGHFSNPH